MHIKNIAPSDIFAHLANSFKKGFALDIAHGATNLNNHHISISTACHSMHAILNLIGDMRDNLNGTTQIFATPLFADH